MVNPYFCYAIAFAIALVMYPLGWSDLYPPLSFSLLIFLILTILLHALAGLVIFKRNSFRVDLTPAENKGVWAVSAFLYLLWIAEFIYGGGIPIIQILLRRPYDYKTFGIPTLHVFIVTFSSFYTIFLFQQYLKRRSARLLFLSAINLLPAIMIYNRGMFLFNLAACIFLYVTYRGHIKFRHIAAGITGGILIAYLFGVMGSIRVSNESREPYSNEGFLQTGKASTSFKESTIPEEFFWAYVYTTSPIANLQQNISLNNPEHCRLASVVHWFNNEVIPDFVSKRINAATGTEKEKIQTIPGPFNATTVYAGSFSYCGWWGLFLMAFVILLVPLLYVCVIYPDSPFFLSGLAIVNTMFLFMVFDNTIRFTGLSFQIVYPILLNIGMARINWIKKVFL